MSVILQGYQLREIALGVQVQKSWTLPASATTVNFFTVANGAVLVTAIFGLVTTLIGSTATTVAIGTVPTIGTPETAGIATATAVTSLEAGTWLGVQSSAGLAGALVSGGHAGNTVWASAPLVVPAGSISFTTSANAGGGVIKWYLHYVPLDTGAAVS